MAAKLTTKDVFLQCQTGMQCHAKLLKTLQKIYQSMDFSEFWAEFSHYLKYSLIVFKREPAVERTVDFVAKFVTMVSLESLTAEASNNDSTIDDTVQGQLLLEMFDFLLKSHSACDRAVRFRCCQMVNKILNNLGEDAQIDDDLYDKIYESMLERLRDKFPVVRLHAVMAMARLQDPRDENCPVIKAYLFLINCDPNPDVRRAVLSCIAPSTKTLPAILERTRDVKDSVRKTAYTVMSEKVHIKALSIANRIRLLHDGLTDRADTVKEACSSKLLQTWLRTFDGNVLELLGSLDVENSLETCQLALQQLFKSSSLADLVEKFDLLDDKKMIPSEKLTSESSMYWQTLCQYIHSLGHEGDEDLENVLPNCVEFCQYLRSFIDGLKNCEDVDLQLEKEFILQQLLQIIGYMDLTDHVFRKTVEKLFYDMLVMDHVGHNLVKYIIPQLCEIKDFSENLVCYFAETVSDIREPITVVEKGGLSQEEQRQNDVRIAKIRVKLNELKEELEEVVNKQEFSRAADIKNSISELEAERSQILDAAEPQTEEIRTEKTDLRTLLKCHTIIAEMLQTLPLKVLSPTLRTLIESLIIPGIQNEDAGVRNIAARALGLCCLLDKDLVLQYLPLFMQASQIDVETVRATAVRVMFDLLHLHGLEAIQEAPQEKQQEEGEETVEDGNQLNSSDTETSNDKQTDGSPTNAASKLVAFLCSFLDSEAADIRTVAAEGVAKLLLSGRVVSSKILSHLLLLWYNPLTEDDTHLRHCLGTFFPIYSFAGRGNQELVEEAFVPTLKTIMNAPLSSPLAEINLENVAELLVHLTNSKLLMENQNTETIADNQRHDSLAVTICNEIISNSTSFNLKLWVKILNQLELSSDNDANAKDLLVLTEEMMELVKDKQCVKSIEKFHNNVKSSLKETLVMDELTSSQTSTVDENDIPVQDNNTQKQDVTEEMGTNDTTKDQSVLDDTVADDGTSFFTETKTIKRTKARSGNASIRFSEKSVSESPVKSALTKTPTKATEKSSKTVLQNDSETGTQCDEKSIDAQSKDAGSISFISQVDDQEKGTKTLSKQAEPKTTKTSSKDAAGTKTTTVTESKTTNRKKKTKSSTEEAEEQIQENVTAENEQKTTNKDKKTKSSTGDAEEQKSSEKEQKTASKNKKAKSSVEESEQNSQENITAENDQETTNKKKKAKSSVEESEQENITAEKEQKTTNKKKKAKSSAEESEQESVTAEKEQKTTNKKKKAKSSAEESEQNSQENETAEKEQSTRSKVRESTRQTTKDQDKGTKSTKSKAKKSSEETQDTPVSVRGGKRMTRSAMKNGSKTQDADDSDLENSVFASPTPRQAAPRAVRKSALGSTRKNLSSAMKEDESSKQPTTPTRKSSRTLRNVQSADLAKK